MSDLDVEAVVIGGSAGSLEALSQILPALPADFPLPIMVVVHLPPDKDSVLAEVLQNKCVLTVCEAQDKQPLQSGTVYFAPPDYHLLVETDRHLSLSYDEPQLYSRPSIDVLFESAADVYGEKLIGIVLSGANADGAHGLKEIAAQGGIALVQTPRHAYAKEMPAMALAQCPGALSLEAEKIADFLRSKCGYDER
ncbi:MAG TPA: chemotaxis protein CheB [Chthoniobacterales bacterium]|nr:chemotaxis protein CheB [Chthoniobacterales bacterium]